MPFERCAICKEYHWTDKPCLPLFEVSWPEYDPDEWFLIRAASPSEAAEKWAGRFDAQGDYDIIYKGNAENVIVRDSNGETFHFDITAETVREYNATRREKEEVVQLETPTTGEK
jgi:hypothetical protein